MHDDVEIIKDDPRSLQRAVHGFGTQMTIFAQFIGDLVHDGAEMRFASACGDDELIGHRRELTHVQNYDVFRLFVICQFPAEQSQFS